MKRKTPFYLLLLCTALPVWGQNLLPLPRQRVWEKGHFDTSLPYAMRQDSGAAPVDTAFLGSWTGEPTKNVSRQLQWCYDASLPSDEAYTLDVGTDTLRITARSAAGFLYAGATLRQLQGEGGIPCCHIADSPQLAWRGAMIDVSRHFYPIDFLKRQVDVLAQFKMNRLHLHLTDAAGWRMEIKRYPRLTNFAAWRTDSLWKDWWNGERRYVEEGTPGAYGGYYTQEELRDLVAYAQERNVTIVPEIEMPAHSEEVLTAYPELSCTHEPYRQADFCPGNEQTYVFLEKVLQEVMDVFPSPYIHIGGDEAGKASWPDCPLCQEKMRTARLASVEELQTYLIRRIGNFLEQHGRQLIGWDEIVAPDLPASTHVMVWRDLHNAQAAIAQGYKVILSPGSHCYLDAYQDAPDTQPEAIGGFLSLEKVYGFAPLAGLSDAEQAHVEGIQGNLWTEYVPTTDHAEYMLYPRLLALAEVGWNGAAPENYSGFRQRALVAAAQLRAQGVHTFDLQQEVGDRPAAAHPVRHMGIGASVTYHHPVNPYYPGQGDTTLVDGIFGGWHHGDGKWQGFIGNACFDVTLDLGEVRNIAYVGTDFLQYVHPDIFFPGRYILSISTDGKTFRTIHQVERAVTDNPAVAAQEWGWQGNERARYIHIEAAPGERKGWIFADEIVVR